MSEQDDGKMLTDQRVQTLSFAYREGGQKITEAIFFSSCFSRTCKGQHFTSCEIHISPAVKCAVRLNFISRASKFHA